MLNLGRIWATIAADPLNGLSWARAEPVRKCICSQFAADRRH